jgi:hypothetical protein
MMDIPITEVVVSKNPAVGKTDNSGKIKVLPSKNLFTILKNADLNIT